MSEARRFRRRLERDAKKGILRPTKEMKELEIPSLEEVQEYINEKLKEKQNGMQLREEETGGNSTTNSNTN